MTSNPPIGIDAARLVADLLTLMPGRYADIRVESLSPCDAWLGVATLTARFPEVDVVPSIAISADEGAHAICNRLHLAAIELHEAWNDPARN